MAGLLLFGQICAHRQLTDGTVPQDNPEYGFLADGEGSAFYHHTLFSALSAMAAQQQPQQHQQYQQLAHPQQPAPEQAFTQSQQAHQAPAAAAEPPPLPSDVVANWDTVLNQLTGSKVGDVARECESLWGAGSEALQARKAQRDMSSMVLDLRCSF